MALECEPPALTAPNTVYETVAKPLPRSLAGVKSGENSLGRVGYMELAQSQGLWGSLGKVIRLLLFYLSESRPGSLEHRWQSSQALSVATLRCVVLTAVISSEPLPSYTLLNHQKNKDSILAIVISMNLLGLAVLFTSAHSSYLSGEN